MEINVSVRSYYQFGGHVTLALAGDFLVRHAPSFGAAIDEIEMTFCFRSHGPPKKTLESMFEEYRAWLERLPTVTFRRKKRIAEVLFSSELLTARELKTSRELSVDLFCNGCREVVEHLKLLGDRIRKDDDFDFARFLSWLNERVQQLPRTINELAAIQADIKAHRAAVWQSLSEWEKLGIDFDDYHPDARSIVDDPFLWEQCDDFSPNGNDTGADLLDHFSDWRKRHRTSESVTFFNQLMRQWGVSIPPTPDDHLSIEVYNEAIVALAFAELKVDGKCSSKTAVFALRVLAEISEEPPPEHWDASIIERRRQSILKMTRTLEAYAKAECG